MTTNQSGMTGPKKRPMPSVPSLWIAKRPTRITHGDRDDEGLQTMASRFEAFDRAEHADRGRDHAVAVEEREVEPIGPDALLSVLYLLLVVPPRSNCPSVTITPTFEPAVRR